MTMRVALSLLRDRKLENRMVEVGTFLGQSISGAPEAFGRFLRTVGHGKLASIDPDKKALSIANQASGLPPDRHLLLHGNAEKILGCWPLGIDFLYLDGGNILSPEGQRAMKRQIETALPMLHDQSIVLMDDYIWGQTNAKTIYAQKVMEDAGWTAVMYEVQILWVKGKWTGWPK